MTSPSGEQEGSEKWKLHDEAVRIVDQRHGYTWEFSADPLGHLAEYESEFERLVPS